MLVRIYDKIAGVTGGTVKDLPTHIAKAIITKGYGEAVDTVQQSSASAPAKEKKVSTPKKKKQ